MKNILIFSTSPRKGGNSETLADAFSKGAIENGNKTEKIYLSEKELHFCKGCLACQHTGKCVIHDAMDEIIPKIIASDIIVFATPIYFYEMSGQMKTLLDRTNPVFPIEYNFRDIYLLATSADEYPQSMDGAIKGLEGWVRCFEKVRLAGVVRGTGVNRSGEINNFPDLLKEAYELGKSA